jgi:hypothetical protein
MFQTHILENLVVPGNRTWNLWICSQEVWPLDHRGGQVEVEVEEEEEGEEE